MEKNTIFFTKLKLFLVCSVLISFFCAIAQPEDKSYLKQTAPASENNNDNFIPISRYGPVVTLSNLQEAIKNPSYYKSVRFSNSGLTDVPEQIFLFPNIEELDISWNALTVLPSRLNELKHLKELHVNRNQLTSFGSEIILCSKLEVIQIQDNPLQVISKGIGEMSTLREITIGEIARNCVVPKELWALTNLTKIKITNAYLTEIPAAVSELKQLDELCLANNFISEVPEELYSLKKITYINLGYNKISSLSSSIKVLENLDYLGIYNNPIAAFPEEISFLTKLSFLSCWNTNLTAREIEKARKKLPITKVHFTETDIH